MPVIELTKEQYITLVNRIYDHKSRVDEYYYTSLYEFGSSMLLAILAIVVHLFSSAIQFSENIFYSSLFMSIYLFFLGVAYVFFFFSEQKYYKENLYSISSIVENKTDEINEIEGENVE